MEDAGLQVFLGIPAMFLFCISLVDYFKSVKVTSPNGFASKLCYQPFDKPTIYNILTIVIIY